MDELYRNLNDVLKYSRLRTQQEWLPFVEEYLDHHARTKGAVDPHTPFVLADFLQDEGDPRAELLRRGGGHGYMGTHSDLLDMGYRETDNHFVGGEYGGLNLSTYEGKKAKQNLPKKLVLGLEFPNATGKGIHRYVESTPEEAHAIVNHLPEEHQQPARDFLKKHYGEQK